MADQKTEKPTQRRLNKAREEGNFPTARTFVGALQFVAFVALLSEGLGLVSWELGSTLSYIPRTFYLHASLRSDTLTIV